jgi:hypothetical protein
MMSTLVASRRSCAICRMMMTSKPGAGDGDALNGHAGGPLVDILRENRIKSEAKILGCRRRNQSRFLIINTQIASYRTERLPQVPRSTSRQTNA